MGTFSFVRTEFLSKLLIYLENFRFSHQGSFFMLHVFCLFVKMKMMDKIKESIEPNTFHYALHL